MGGREISDISPLGNLTNLLYLHIPWSSITDISPLFGLYNLIELELQNNPLTYRRVNELRDALPNCDIRFKSEWTVLVNGEDMEIDVIDTDQGPFIPVDVLRLMRGDVRYVVEMLNEQGLAQIEVTGINISMDVNNDWGQTFYDDFFLFYDGNKVVMDYDFYTNQPIFREFDDITYINIYSFEWFGILRDSHMSIRRDDRTLFIDGNTDPTYEYLPRPRPTHWRFFLNGEEMPVEVMLNMQWSYSRSPYLEIYLVEFLDLFDAEYVVTTEGVTRGGMHTELAGQNLLVHTYGTANSRNRFGTMGINALTHPTTTLEDANAARPATGNWGVTSVDIDHYNWIVYVTSDWQVSESTVAFVNIEDLPPLVIAPPPPAPLPDTTQVWHAFYRQRDETPKTNADLAQAIASGEIPANTTELVIRLWGDEITDLSPLAALKDLRHFYMDNTQVSDLSPLANLPNLVQIWIERSPVNDLSPLVGLSNLTELHIVGSNELRDISPVGELTNLKHLGLVGTQVRDISAVRALTNLEVLNVRNSPVRDIGWLHGLTNLTELHLGGTRVIPEQVNIFQSAHSGCDIYSDVPT